MALMPAEVRSLAIRRRCLACEGVKSELSRGATTFVGDAMATCGPPTAVTAPYPVDQHSRLGRRWLWPWRHRGWSRLDSRPGHRLSGRTGGEIGRGGSEGGNGDCWAGERSLADAYWGLGWRESLVRTASHGPEGEFLSCGGALHKGPAAPTTETRHRRRQERRRC